MKDLDEKKSMNMHHYAPVIKNPVLRGFNPDPSIVRVGADYYIAVSTFEWFPGVLIYHSRDLVNWHLVATPLNRISQLDLRGVDSSEGVWAPCLSYHDGVFYLIYTVVLHWSYNGPRDLHNYLVTSSSVTGEWSEPVYLNSSGFDPSLFHDEDGRSWLLNMCWDPRSGHTSFSGILLQEYSKTEKRLVGPVKNIFKGTDLGWVEGPHLYKYKKYYYLMTAEGGTKFHHAVTLARSAEIAGPYEVHPENPVLTSFYYPESELKKAGHGSLVQTTEGEWYLAHLCARPLPGRGRCILGRETALQKVVWKDDGWLYLAHGSRKPQTIVEAPGLPECTWVKEPVRDDFDSPVLPMKYQSLRVPLTEQMISLTERPGYVRLYGMESLGSRFKQSLIARRQQAFCYIAETAVEFEPDTFAQMAGLVVIYDIRNFFYLHVTWDDETEGRILNLIACEKGIYREELSQKVSLGDWKRCWLKAVMRYDILQFFYSEDGTVWNAIGKELDSSVLSDDYMDPVQFTGAFVGICCQDLTGGRKPADFDYFEYREQED